MVEQSVGFPGAKEKKKETIKEMIHEEGFHLDVAPADKDEVINEFLQKIDAYLKHDFHKPSRTHVVYCLSIGRRGVKAFGDFPEEARRNFYTTLRATLQEANWHEVYVWYDRLNSGNCSHYRSKITENKAGSNWGAITEYFVELCENQVQMLASRQGGHEMEEAISRALMFGWEKVESEINHTKKSDLLRIIKEKSNLPRNSQISSERKFVKQKISMTRENFARIQVQAHEIGVGITDLCAYLIVKFLYENELRSGLLRRSAK